MDIRTPTAATSRIPERRALPFFGHALQVPRDGRVTEFLIAEAESLGPIYRLRIFENEMIMVSGPELVAELSDPGRFIKSVHAELEQLRPIGGDGLFTAYNEEPNWRKAHNILMPAFTRDSMRGYHSKMVGAARNLIAYWNRMAHEGRPVDVSRDMTRLTFDTIGVCGFGYEFDSFSKDELHPFVESMVRALIHAQEGNGLPKFVDRLRFRSNRKYANDIASMQNLISSLIDRRRAEAPERTDDLLGRMLNTIDPASGEPLDDANIRNQVVTFLVAGHETTGAALSFALYYLMKHPSVLRRAQQEVDLLWGQEDNIDPKYEDVGKLTYVRQVIEEALRLWPTAPGYAVTPIEETVVAGRYRFEPGDTIVIFTPSLHRQPEWGANVHTFDPDRFEPEAVAARPGHLYKPFGNGERACIGRQFALHEATLVLGMLVHRFRLNDHANYQLKIGTTLTIKPDGFTVLPQQRMPSERITLMPVTGGEPNRRMSQKAEAGTFSSLAIFHGSNLGTSAGLARELAAIATDKKRKSSIASLNEGVNKLGDLAADTLMLIVASSYNGRPTDDAAEFIHWIETLQPGSLEGLHYAILGVGDRTYAATYQRIPTVIDERLSAAGAKRIGDRGALDVGGDFSANFDSWSATLWDAFATGENVRSEGETTPSELAKITIEPVDARRVQRAKHYGMVEMSVVESAELVDLTNSIGRSKRFLRLELPDGHRYRTADHLAVLPSNPSELVERIGARLGLDLDQAVRLRIPRRLRLFLPEDRPITISRILQDYVELQDPASLEDVRLLVQNCQCPPERKPLVELADLKPEAFAETITLPRVSLLDLLERYRSINMTFDEFLERLSPLAPRRYSISSSNISNPATLDLMVSLVDAPHRDCTGNQKRRYRGIASNYLAQLRAGDTVMARVVACNEAFRLEHAIPAILVAAGTGLAPFRGMIADRLASPGSAPLITYFGCDHPDVDYLHRQELKAAECAGVVSLRTAFTFAPVEGWKFVQDRMFAERDELWSFIKAGAQIRVCGDAARLGAGVEAALLRIYQACAEENDGLNSELRARQWLDSLRAEQRYVSDVW